MTAAQVNGTSLAYAESGSGVPVFFVHGSLADFRSWNMQKVPFSRHYRVIAYSRRYHYPNPREDGGVPYSATLHAADLAALIQSLASEPVHIIGSSFGAYVALMVAVRQPGLVRSLVLGEPPLFPWLEEIPGGASLLSAFYSQAWEPARVAFHAGDAVAGVRYFLDGVIGPGAFDAMPDRGRAGIMKNVAEMTRETSAADYFSPLSRQEAGAVTQPVLLLGGEASPRIFATVLEELPRILPRAVRRTIPAASHSMHIDNPAVYNEAVLGFLGEN